MGKVLAVIRAPPAHSQVHAVASAALDVDADVRWKAAEVLATLGEPGARALAALLAQDPAAEARARAAQVFGFLGAAWPPALALAAKVTEHHAPRKCCASLEP